MPGFLPDEVHITRFVSPISMNENSMTRNTSLLVKFSSFLLILLVLETHSYDIESAMKRATVGPNVFLGSDGVKGKLHSFQAAFYAGYAEDLRSGFQGHAACLLAYESS